MLVVDDHEELAETVATGLRHEGMVVLELLLAARGAVISPEELLARAWDEARGSVQQRGQGDDQPAAPQAR